MPPSLSPMKPVNFVASLSRKQKKKLVKSDENDIDDKSRRIGSCQNARFNNKHGRMFSIRLLEIIRFSLIKRFLDFRRKSSIVNLQIFFFVFENLHKSQAFEEFHRKSDFGFSA